MAEDPRELVRSYAQALLTVADAEGALERVEDELFRVARTVEGNRDLRERLSDPGVDTAERLALIDDLFSTRAHPQTVSALLFVVQSGRARQLTEIADEFARLSAESRAQALAEVRTAVELKPEQERRLAEALSEVWGRDVDLKVVVDPDVVGGVVAKIGDTVIDGSVSRRLAELSARLTGA